MILAVSPLSPAANHSNIPFAVTLNFSFLVNRVLLIKHGLVVVYLVDIGGNVVPKEPLKSEFIQYAGSNAAK